MPVVPDSTEICKTWSTLGIDLLLRIAAGVERIETKQGGIVAELDDLKQAVADTQASITTAVTHIGQMQAQIQQLQANPEIPAGTLDALAASLEAAQQSLTAALNPPASTPAPATGSGTSAAPSTSTPAAS